jgi:hypothetical protein
VDDLLFTRGGNLQDALEHRAQEMVQEIEHVPEEHLVQADRDAWAVALAESYAVPCPVLNRTSMWREKVQEVTIDVSWDGRRYFSDPSYARNFPGYRVVVHVPFDGEADVFKFRPSSFTLNPPRARVTDRDVFVSVEYPRDSQPDIDGQVNGVVDNIEHWLHSARQDIEAFNAGLEGRAMAAIDARRRRIEERDAHLAKSTIPEGPPGAQAKTEIVSAVVRRPAPSLPKRQKQAHQAIDLEPTLADEIYEHILGLIRSHATSMEQNPNTYRSLDEEDRRTTILALLNSHYEGRGAAEAFNGQGKTDILIRYEGKNIFIAECKFWRGEKEFIAAIDQLFRYTGWRDTKLALILFVEEKGLTAIITKARAALLAHSQFVSAQPAATETELRATMSWPGDRERLAMLNITFVHTPRR